MEKLTITTPSDVLSFIGHILGFWPQESLVCITLNENSIGATLRIDLPRQPGQELPYARTVAHYLTSDTTATSVLFAVYTSETSQHGQARPQAGTIAALTGVLAEQGITIRDGLFVGDDTFSPYDGEPGTRLALPVSSTQTSVINAEFIYRGSFIEPTERIAYAATSSTAWPRDRSVRSASTSSIGGVAKRSKNDTNPTDRRTESGTSSRRLPERRVWSSIWLTAPRRHPALAEGSGAAPQAYPASVTLYGGRIRPRQ
jgi:hypothetical protein